VLTVYADCPKAGDAKRTNSKASVFIFLLLSRLLLTR
jgi:hypothetical protein